MLSQVEHFSPTLLRSLEPGMVVVLGIPFDEASSFLRGPALAPRRIREVLHAGSMNLCTESGIDLGAEPRIRDLGDLELTKDVTAHEQIAATIRDLVACGVYVLSLGGDHAITFPIVQAYQPRYPDLTILHLDAHSDLYDEYHGNRFSHACPFARIMEGNLASRLVQVGIRTLNPLQRAQAERFGVEVIEIKSWRPEDSLILEGPLYLSLDMDVLDPAFAPGVSHHEPGGMSTRDLLRLIQGLKVPLVGADIVEFNPARDPVGVTAMTAAKLLKEIAACMLELN